MTDELITTPILKPADEITGEDMAQWPEVPIRTPEQIEPDE